MATSLSTRSSSSTTSPELIAEFSASPSRAPITSFATAGLSPGPSWSRPAGPCALCATDADFELPGTCTAPGLCSTPPRYYVSGGGPGCATGCGAGGTPDSTLLVLAPLWLIAYVSKRRAVQGGEPTNQPRRPSRHPVGRLGGRVVWFPGPHPWQMGEAGTTRSSFSFCSSRVRSARVRGQKQPAPGLSPPRPSAVAWAMETTRLYRRNRNHELAWLPSNPSPGQRLDIVKLVGTTIARETIWYHEADWSPCTPRTPSP